MHSESSFKRGDIIEIDGLLGAIVGTDAEDWVPADHVAIWFGNENTKRISQGGLGGATPEIWTVPVQYCILSKPANVNH